MLELVRELDAGHDVAVTPDGPRGPRRAFAAGAIVASLRSGAPIVAFGATADRTWRLRTWDRFVIPKPFARVTIRYSPATHPESASPRDAEAQGPRFEQLLAAVCAPDEP